MEGGLYNGWLISGNKVFLVFGQFQLKREIITAVIPWSLWKRWCLLSHIPLRSRTKSTAPLWTLGKEKSNKKIEWATEFFYFCVKLNSNKSKEFTLSKPLLHDKRYYKVFLSLIISQASTNTIKDSSKSLYGGPLSLTSKSHVRPRGQTMTEQVKESQMTLSFPLNSNWKIGRI